MKIPKSGLTEFENRFQLRYEMSIRLPMTLGDVSVGSSVMVIAVSGEAAFRRRLMELGVLPGTRIELVRVAPLGDPMELRVRGCALSIRRDEARSIAVDLLAAELPLRPTSDVTEVVGIGPSVAAAP